MKFKYLGHSAFLFYIEDFKILVDPFLMYSDAKEINDISCDYLLVTHAHFDHTRDVERIASNNNAMIITNHEIATFFAEKGLSTHGMNIGGSFDFPFGNIKCVQAVHSSSFEDGTYGGNPMGFLIKTSTHHFYISGDTALHMDMRLIPIIAPKLDFALLCIGNNFTMGYEDALIASDFISCDQIVACHYDTFDLIKVDKSIVTKAFEHKQKNIIFPEIGKYTQL